MVKRAAEFPVRYQGRAATLSFGQTAVRLFDRTSFALFKTYPDPTAVSVTVSHALLEVTDGIDVLSVAEDGVPLDQVAAAFDVGSRSFGSVETVVIPIATAGFIAGREITKTIGIVGGSAVVPAAVFQQLSGRSRGALDGRSESYGQDLSTARRMAFAAMRDEAALGEADAVISVTVTYETVGAGTGHLLVTATGTAVKLD